MGFEVWVGKPEFDHAHEEEAAERITQTLEHLYGRSEEFCFLVLNFHCSGEDLDALVLKKRAILIIDFKECNKPVVGSVNGNWHIKGDTAAILNEGRRNPYQQVRDYRYALMRYLDEHRHSFLAPQKATQASFEHISCAVCFTPDKHPASEFDVDFSRERWFHVVGLSELGSLVRRERSSQISLSKTDARRFVKDALHCVRLSTGRVAAPAGAADDKVYSRMEQRKEQRKMPYTAEISRVNSGCFLFLIDQSDSMSEPFGGSEIPSSKADALADAINRLLSNLIIKCSKDMKVWRYFQVGVVGYGASVGPALAGDLAGQDLVWIDDIYNHPLRIEQRTQRVSDGAGGLVETQVKLPVWFDPVAANGTPMCQAFSVTHAILQSWVAQHPSSFPPVVINITDGESTDGDPSEAAEALKALATQDGNLLFLNLHLSARRAVTVHFPDTEEILADQYARLLFRLSSRLPDCMRGVARELGHHVSDDARGFVFNADIEDVIDFLEIGTQPSNLR